MDREAGEKVVFGEPGQITALINARLIDGRGGEPVEGAVVRIRDGDIVGVGREPVQASEVSVDCNGMTLLPGLIDAHAHLIYTDFRSLDAVDRCSIETSSINAVNNARKVLDAGYTTIRDVGTVGNVAVAMRDAVADGKVAGPRIIASGQIIFPTGGLGETLPPHWTSDHGLGRRVDSPDAMRAEVRRQIRHGVDNIKLAASGVEVGPYAWTWMTTFSEEEIAVAVEEAHRWGRTVAVHAQSYDSVRFSLNAGVDTIEHGTRIDAETAKAFAQSDTVLVPTLSTLFSVIELGSKLNLMPKQREEMKVNEPLWIESMLRCRDEGVPIASGADLGNRYPHGANAREIELLSRVGLSPMEALLAATAVAAKALKLDHEVGTIEEGKRADLLLFNGDPLTDIASLQDAARIALVVKAGLPAAGFRA
ncbi:MAG: hypothetical protein BGN87_23535 [Rhizobiales bacterium 65-79]|jgi:imidazolonepropionase-like amidohydrolase|nr:amidohydrolase family protein [Hyphomicrobiales bacterium]OJU01421.1 MAG: hypothetical protein BGN87_23535 [Rhizobiales bacterium 65-79]